MIMKRVSDIPRKVKRF